MLIGLQKHFNTLSRDEITGGLNILKSIGFDRSVFIAHPVNLAPETAVSRRLQEIQLSSQTAGWSRTETLAKFYIKNLHML